MIETVLAAAGIALLIIAVIGFAWVFISRRKHVRDLQSEAERPQAAPAPAATLRERYNSMCLDLLVPPGAMTVTGSAFSCGAEPMRMYCWIVGGELVLLPLWESVESRYGGLPPESVPLYSMHIPLVYIVCYSEQQCIDGKSCSLQYKSPEGVPLALGFSADSTQVFDALIPKLAYDCQFERQYPHSYRNLQDINEMFLRLKELRRRDLISEDEYSEKKKQLLIKM